MDAAFAQRGAGQNHHALVSRLGSVGLSSLDPQLSYYGQDVDAIQGEWGSISDIDQFADGQYAYQGEPGAFGEEPPTPALGEVQKRPRACEGCRGLKVRCDFPPDAASCKRCEKARRQCVVTVSSRKRQRRTDPKVADLERRIDDLTATLEEQKKQMMLSHHGGREADAGGAGPNDESNGSTDPYMPAMAFTTEHVRKRRKPSSQTVASSPYSSSPGHRTSGLAGMSLPASLPAPPPSSDAARVYNEYADVIDRGLLSSERAAAVFAHYRDHMAAHLPCVVFPADVTPGAVRKTRPVLFLAILSVAAGQDLPGLRHPPASELHRSLAREAMKTVADRVLCRGEKSLELVQALQVLTVWHTPDEPRDSMTFQLIQLACSMAIALNLNGSCSLGLVAGSRPPSVEPEPGQAVSREQVEKRRAWLSCFLLSGVCSLPMRQQNTVRWSPFLEETVQLLRSQPDNAADEALCKWVDVQRIADRTMELAGAVASPGADRKAGRIEVQDISRRLRALVATTYEQENCESRWQRRHSKH